MPSTELVAYQAMPLADRQQYALTVARAAALLPSGLRGANADETAAKAFLIMETGSMLGLHPIAALSSVNVIEGKPAMSADLMVATVRAAGHRVDVREEGTIEGGDYRATVTLTRSDGADPTTSTWTPHRAARAGLCTYEQRDGVWRVTAVSQRGNPLPWQTYTEALCKARAKSECMRDGGSDVLHGVRYTPEELGAEVTGDGEVVDRPTETSAPIDRTEHWKALIDAATTKAEVEGVVADCQSAQQFTDAVRTAALARFGILGREEARRPVDADVVPDEARAEPAPARTAEPEPTPASPRTGPIPRPTVDRSAFARPSVAESKPERDPAEPTSEEWARIRAAEGGDQ